MGKRPIRLFLTLERDAHDMLAEGQPIHAIYRTKSFLRSIWPVDWQENTRSLVDAVARNTELFIPVERSRLLLS